jgi:hypothetical protein
MPRAARDGKSAQLLHKQSCAAMASQRLGTAQAPRAPRAARAQLQPCSGLGQHATGSCSRHEPKTAPRPAAAAATQTASPDRTCFSTEGRGWAQTPLKQRVLDWICFATEGRGWAHAGAWFAKQVQDSWSKAELVKLRMGRRAWSRLGRRLPRRPQQDQRSVQQQGRQASRAQDACRSLVASKSRTCGARPAQGRPLAGTVATGSRYRATSAATKVQCCGKFKYQVTSGRFGC